MTAAIASDKKTQAQTGAKLVVRNLEAQGVQHVFGVPGAKIDAVFDALADSKIQTMQCRHEQNAAFIAGGIGRMTGKAGVVLVTSGPGCSNLVTGLATATSEGDPIVAIGGSVAIEHQLKQVHQTMDTIALFRPITKYTASIDSPETVSEVIGNAFRIAESPRAGASFVSASQNVMAGATSAEVLSPVLPQQSGAAADDAIAAAAELTAKAHKPVIILGMLASEPAAAEAIRAFLYKTKIPVVSTFQAAGVVPRDLFDIFGGRIGLFHNQPGDNLLDAADLVITVGYDPIEYEPAAWNKGFKRNLIHIGVQEADVDRDYRPSVSLVGNIASTMQTLTSQLQARALPGVTPFLEMFATERAEFIKQALAKNGLPVHPMRLVHELQQLVTDDMTLCVDVGSFMIWLARHLYNFRPRQLLFSNGQQTLGVGLPWAIAASLVRPHEKVLSISGDGGFLYSAMELETAVRLKCNLVHMVWIDGSYDMVKFQELAKYGRPSGVNLGHVDVVRYAEAFGAKGLEIKTPDDITPIMKRALETEGPVLVSVNVDYRDNLNLMRDLRSEVIV